MTAPPFTERPPATPRRSWSDWLPSTPALPTDPITPSDPGGPTRADRVIMHIDMDAFYASVELRRRPELLGRPMFVGGAERGVVLSANYEARAFGIEGGMPSSRARRLCPQAVAVPPDFDTYGEVSAGIVAAFESVTAHVESASIDEAYLDVTGSQRVFGSPRAIGEYLRALVADEQGITCSVGIGPSKFVAKIASGQAKPDGLVEVLPGDVTSFLHPLPVGKIWGVGEATADKLHRLGIMTVADLANTPAGTLRRAFGPHQGSLLSELAWGRDGRRVVARPGERGVGCQETFSRDTDDPAVVRAELLRVAGTVAWRMRQAGVLGRVVTLNLRFADFRTISRSLTLASPTDSTDELHAQALKLLGKLGLERPRIRRVGIRVEGLVDADKAYCQPTLDAPDRGWREAELAADAVRRKFGPNGVQRAVLTRHGYAPKRP
ncbi:DNA polymerase IV [Micropruina glycogenica]|uniref:DNA polymerase IV n=1 Tax=Micropruina glycogenica TaxID=75385 RepID=A0A2N9JGB7_9ACTN|nr:DNA polymerase IV [Micropruina glycogenica]SPD87144.1 DNA polymerase IV [Micropruina glycogenica]